MEVFLTLFEDKKQIVEDCQVNCKKVQTTADKFAPDCSMNVLVMTLISGALTIDYGVPFRQGPG